MAFESLESYRDQYTFKEIVSATDVKPYVLRFWESEFCEISPVLADEGSKVYTQSDLDFILRVKELLFEKKMSIPEAKAHISNQQINIHMESVMPVTQTSPSLDLSEAVIKSEEVEASSSELVIAKDRMRLMLDKIELISKNHSWDL